MFRFTKFEPECLELRSSAFPSFLAIFFMVGLLAIMVDRKNLTDKQHVRLKDYLLEHLPHDVQPRGILKAAAVKFPITHQTCSRLLERVACGTCYGLKWRMGGCDIGKEGFWPWP
jgi:hypothetical protein